MRNTKNNTETQGVVCAQEILSEKISKANHELTRMDDFSSVEEQIDTLIFTWVTGDYIDGLESTFKVNTITFIKDLKSLLKTVFEEEEKPEFNFLKLYDDFFDTWGSKGQREVLDYLASTFIYSDLANDQKIRSDVFMFLEFSTKFLRAINKVNKERKAIELSCTT